MMGMMDEMIANAGWQRAFEIICDKMKGKIEDENVMMLLRCLYKYKQYLRLPDRETVKKKLVDQKILITGEHPEEGQRGVCVDMVFDEDLVGYKMLVRLEGNNIVSLESKNILVLIKSSYQRPDLN